MASTFVSLWLAEITVSESSTALAVSGLVSSDKKYFLQCSQVQYSLFPSSVQVASFASTFISLWLAGITVSESSTALAVSGLVSSDKKYFPQCSQVQYALFPSSVQVASFASTFVSLWLAGITVSESSTALAVSGLVSSDKKYFPQCSQVQYALFPSSVQVASFASTFVSLWLAEITVSDNSTALAVSGLVSSDKKYFPQCSQVQYSVFPSSVQVVSFASTFVSLWLAGITVSESSTALAVSGLVSSDKKYFPQCSQVQYSLLPSSEQVASFAAVLVKIC